MLELFQSWESFEKKHMGGEWKTKKLEKKSEHNMFYGIWSPKKVEKEGGKANFLKNEKRIAKNEKKSHFRMKVILK